MRIPDHYMTHNYFVFDGKSSMDFGLGISGSGTFTKPHRRVERFTVPGRHGTLTISDDTFEDVEITYPCYFANGFSARYDALCAWLFSKKGMVRLEDTYHPEHFRLAEFTGDISPDMGTLNFSGKFDLTFRCDGRKFLKSGERMYIYSPEEQMEAIENGAFGIRIVNPTPFASRPLLGIRELGRILFEDSAKITLELGATITRNDDSASRYDMSGGWNFIDCETGESYDFITKTSNNAFTKIEGNLPVLMPGENFLAAKEQYYNTELAVIPRWYTI